MPVFQLDDNCVSNSIDNKTKCVYVCVCVVCASATVRSPFNLPNMVFPDKFSGERGHSNCQIVSPAENKAIAHISSGSR